MRARGSGIERFGLARKNAQGVSTRLVDAVSFSIGAPVDFAKLGAMEDPHVCAKGMQALLDAIRQLRDEGREGRPLLAVVSTTGVSARGRDVPLLFVPFYHLGLRVPHADKKVVEDMVAASGEQFVLVRPSLLTDGDGAEGKEIRVGVEDLVEGWRVKAVGYVISREAVGRWLYENVLAEEGGEYLGKAVSITW